jgi:hypothetical protein
MFARSDHRYTVLAHQTANTTVADIQADIFQLLSQWRNNESSYKQPVQDYLAVVRESVVTIEAMSAEFASS